MITIVGMGPGADNMVTPAAREALESANVIVGSDRWLEGFSGSDKELIAWRPAEAFIEEITERARSEDVAVMVTGDPGLFSFLGTIKRKDPSLPVSVIPGISSAQLFFSRLEMDWSDVVIASVHGRDLSCLETLIHPGARLCLLTDGTNSPREIGVRLRESQVGGRAIVAEKLSDRDEKITRLTLPELASFSSRPPAILFLEIHDG